MPSQPLNTQSLCQQDISQKPAGLCGNHENGAAEVHFIDPEIGTWANSKEPVDATRFSPPPKKLCPIA
jgi:hypothetical protein